MLVPFSAIMLAGTLLLPVAETVPKLDVESNCRAAAKMGESLNARFPRCMADEQSARDELQSGWLTFSKSLREQCTATAQIGGISSYVELLECLVIGRDAAKMEKDNPQDTKL